MIFAGVYRPRSFPVCQALFLDTFGDVNYNTSAPTGTLAQSGEAVPLLKQISSSTFNAQLNVATQVVSENPHLYYEIQQGNENTAQVSRQFRSVLDELITAVVENEEEVFARHMGAAKQRLASVEKKGIGG